jgi:hypothetical protein
MFAPGIAICDRPGFTNVVVLWPSTIPGRFQPEYTDGIGRLIGDDYLSTGCNWVIQSCPINFNELKPHRDPDLSSR